ncbi:hypothetical protein STCU_03980 [Strigomonas culicis]|uniref:Uncharacterized protein n=1 Tax=Strigomonas culicis TaxID=28005 RepID=S9VU11_9TRYP|nr:hypothetical protein STCU_04529 [Strigomonas culicis]EPY30611.1 hypothetical protein STCU_03980 [Strigomonas culicis]|eukprot:EPY29492.1 hypothetical protein STCU_04529 [Strigomonas culicis]
MSSWTPQQLCYRSIMRALRAAYFHDRARLFWARHRVLVEMYKYARVTDEEQIRLLVGIGNEIAAFAEHYMKMDVARIVRYNDAMVKLPVEKAKKFRSEYLLSEKQHESWCKQRIRGILERRPPPPYPFY